VINTRIGNYRILERIGDGGMGTVYRAVDEMLDREVALKVMRPELSRQAALSARFREEAIALARLHHPNIATVFGMERAGDDLVLVLEFVRGETLEALVQRMGRMDWARAVAVCSDVLLALDHAHDAGVVHRDIKPANIMAGRNGAVKVMDFGIARIMGRSRQTRVGSAVGTPHYMSPEQLRGEEVDGRSDLYSLGAVLFELVTGQMPFDADSDYELMMKQLNQPVPAITSLVPGVPDELDRVVARAMAKQREERYPTASAMREDLRRALQHVAAPVMRPAPPTRLGDTGSATPATRLSDAAAPAEFSSTAPPTRLGSVETRSFVPPTRLVPADVAHRGAQWVSDWRVWSGVAGVLVVAALAIRFIGDGGPVDPAPTNADTSALADAGRRIIPGSLGDTAYRPPPQVDQPAPIVPPPVPTGGVEPTRVVPSEPPPTTGGTVVPGRRTPPPDPAPRNPVSTRVADPAPEKSRDSTPAMPTRPVQQQADPTPVPAPTPPAEDEATAKASISGVIREFTGSVGARQNDRVAAVLQLEGDVARQWYELMGEGRLSMSVAGAPDVEVAGGRATARFSADLNVRSAFGANRRRSAQFVAELSRSSGSWRLVSVRPTGAVSLN
jgi:serine/threonine-protein kinase